MPSADASSAPRSSENPPLSPPSPSSPVPRFSPEEEAELLHESHIQKIHANKLYSSRQYSQAVSEYDKAVASCPIYLEYEVAVLKANVAACHLHLKEWQAAVDSATAALDALERLGPSKGSAATESSGKDDQKQPHEAVLEFDEGADEASVAQSLDELEIRDQQMANVQKIRIKALLRRAKAKSELSGWGNLQGAEEDYKAVVAAAGSSSSREKVPLSAKDREVVQAALRTLPGRITACREKETAEMMGKLKELGNGILKPFGLSTDMFKMTKDEKTGGYSVNFDQGR